MRFMQSPVPMDSTLTLIPVCSSNTGMMDSRPSLFGEQMFSSPSAAANAAPPTSITDATAAARNFFIWDFLLFVLAMDGSLIAFVSIISLHFGKYNHYFSCFLHILRNLSVYFCAIHLEPKSSLFRFSISFVLPKYKRNPPFRQEKGERLTAQTAESPEYGRSNRESQRHGTRSA